MIYRDPYQIHNFCTFNGLKFLIEHKDQMKEFLILVA